MTQVRSDSTFPSNTKAGGGAGRGRAGLMTENNTMRELDLESSSPLQCRGSAIQVEDGGIGYLC